MQGQWFKQMACTVMLAPLVVMVAGCASPSPPEQKAQTHAGAQLATPLGQADGNTHPGRAIYENNCAVCHGVGGGGNSARLNDPEFVKRLSDKQIEDTIRFGTGGMPAFETVLTPEQLKALVQYVRTLPQSSEG